MKLRGYQENSVEGARKILSRLRAALLQLPTGSGKTAIFSKITEKAFKKKSRVWIVVPRDELMQQTSETLRSIGVSHNKITPKSNESRAYPVHIAMQRTLINRINADRIKNWPDLIIFDEAHLSLDQQKTIKDAAPTTTKFIGVTATPERTDGRGLTEVYNDITLGPTLKWLIDKGYLSKFKYFCPPPPEGINSIRKKGFDYDKKELEDLLKKRHVYGSVIAHYKEIAEGKPCLVFCPSVKSAEETAERFNEAGYNFLSIDGKSKDRKEIIRKLRAKEIDGVTNCDLATYGLDVPVVKCIIMLRRTMSKALFFQMIGRGLRPDPEEEYCIFLDHVGAINEFFDSTEELITFEDWNFTGETRNKRKKGDDIVSPFMCNKCFMYFTGSVCDNCGKEKDIKAEAGLVEVEGRLVEIQGPIKLKDRPREEQSELMARKSDMVERRDVVGLLDMAKELGYKPMWAYRAIVEDGPVDVELVKRIAEIKGYKSGWVKLTVKQIRG
jgi:superfamily II DNA or RNA helicase